MILESHNLFDICEHFLANLAVWRPNKTLTDEKDKWVNPKNWSFRLGYGRSVNRATERPLVYNAERERRLRKRKMDGLLQDLLDRNQQKYPHRHHYLLLKGNRNMKRTIEISVEFQFTTQFLAHIGLDNNKVTNMIAVRTINVTWLKMLLYTF